VIVRSFVAIELPEGWRRTLADATASLRHDSKEFSWVAQERLHITLTFLGEVDEPTLSRLRPRLERAAGRTAPFELRLGSGGRFGRRVLYASVSGNRDQLIRLAERTTAASRREGIEVSDASRHPHITLARARQQADLRPFTAALTDLHAPDWRVTEVTLLKSLLGPDPHYEPIAQFPLAQPPASDL
jgi:2'-5' RNA ligase